MAGTAVAQQSLEQRFSESQARLQRAEQREGVLTSEIERLSERITSLEATVADLRNKEAIAAAELRQRQRELEEAASRLAALRARLQQAIALLEERLIAIYKSGEPDLLTVILDASGFEDLLAKTEYLERLERQDEMIVGRVRGLRNEMRRTVELVRAARDSIAARKRELEASRVELERQSAALTSARSARSSALAGVRDERHEIEGDLSKLSKQIEEQLADSGGPVLPAGPIRGGSSGLIWPVNGELTSTFGPRWGRMHEGIDIAAPGGTPIRAAKAGTIAFAAYNGGYGNYTCLEHGGGLSTCYAHQQGFARTSGSVGQGTVIGYVGTTGSSTGNHLHFEVRVNGAAVDPLGYL